MTKIIQLPAPQTELEYPLMKAIARRRTKRKWKDEPLSEQELSNLLWAACGITHPANKKSKSRRTAPSACNSQELKVYVALASGVFLYNEEAHQLIRVHATDIRKHIGKQKMMQSAPVGLIYISDFTRLKTFQFNNDEIRWFTSATDVGFMSQNVYLYCAAANLSTAILGLVDKDKLQGLLGLSDTEKVVYTQVVGKAVDFPLDHMDR